MIEFHHLLDDLVADARVVAWAEGVHLRHEYLLARNAAVGQLISRGVTLLASETHFALASAANDHVQAGAAEPSRDAVRAVWSWATEPLAENAILLQLLAEHNRHVPAADRVRLCGLDAYGYGTAGPAAGLQPLLDQLPGSDRSDLRRQHFADAVERWSDGQRERLRHGVTSELVTGLERLAASVSDDDSRRMIDIYRRLALHQESDGDHRDIAVRDDLQYRNLLRAARDCHPTDRIMIFEQVEHLDPSLNGSLGDRLAAGELGPVVTIGALWSPADPTVRYPLGRYRPLAEWLDRRTRTDDAEFSLVDLRPWRGSSSAADRPAAAAPFDAVVYVRRTTHAARWANTPGT